MSLRNKIINLIEDNYGSDSIFMILETEGNCTREQIFESLHKKDEIFDEEMVKTNSDSMSFPEWFISTINKLREEIKSNNEYYKDISKHDIIRYKQHFQNNNVLLSNELYHLKKYVAQLETDKKLTSKIRKVKNLLKMC